MYLLFLLAPLLPCHAAVSDRSYSSIYMLWTQYVFCAVVLINAMSALGSHKRALEYYFIFTGFRWLFHKSKHTRKIVCSSKERFQTKMLNMLLFLKERMNTDLIKSSHLCRSFFYVPSEWNFMSQYCQRSLGFRALVFLHVHHHFRCKFYTTF